MDCSSLVGAAVPATGYVGGHVAMQIEQGSLAMVTIFESVGPDEIPDMTESGSSGRIVPRSIYNIGRYSKIPIERVLPNWA